jgi:hypothetical protein
MSARILTGVGAIFALALVAALVGDAILHGVQTDRRQAREAAAEHAQSLLAEAEAALKDARQAHRRTREAEAAATERKIRRLLDEAAGLLSSSLAASAPQSSRPAAKRATPRAGVLAALGFTEAPEPPAEPTEEEEDPSSPLRVLATIRNDLNRLATEAGGVLRLEDEHGRLLWRSGDPSTLAGPAERRGVPFRWGEALKTWRVEAVGPGPEGGEDLPVSAAVETLRTDPALRSATERGIVFALLDTEGRAELLLPPEAEAPPAPDMAGAWRTPEPDSYRARTIRRTFVRPAPGGRDRILAAGVVLHEASIREAAWQQIRARPALLATPVVTLLAAIALLIWSLSPRRNVTREAYPYPAGAGPRLLRTGPREVSEDADVLVAEFPEDDGYDPETSDPDDALHWAPEDRRVIPPEERSSNVVRLREMYRVDAGRELDLGNRVRSDVLRRLLDEVGRPAGADEDAADV